MTKLPSVGLPKTYKTRQNFWKGETVFALFYVLSQNQPPGIPPEGWLQSGFLFFFRKVIAFSATSGKKKE